MKSPESRLNFDLLVAAAATAHGHDLVPLDSLSAPLVGSLQAQIRAQRFLIERMSEAVKYTLDRIFAEPKLFHLFYLTEAHCGLTTALANGLVLEREKVAKNFGAHHDARIQYGCIDDGFEKEAA
jgi:hypothetical protein